MINRSIVPVLFFLLLAGSLLLAGCGGIQETSEASVSSESFGPVSLLAWDPPRTYDDFSPLDPYLDLDYYEFYIRADMNFTDDDLPVAQVAAVVNILSPNGRVYQQNLTTGFDLQYLLPFVPPGLSGYLSIRAVGIDGVKSEFSQPVYWNLNKLS